MTLNDLEWLFHIVFCASHIVGDICSEYDVSHASFILQCIVYFASCHELGSNYSAANKFLAGRVVMMMC